MLSAFKNYQDHLNFFKLQNIDISYPGFYDDRRFLELEQSNPNLLDNYASFISQKIFDKEYLDRAEKIIRTTASLLNNELQKDGRQGACVDVSMTLSRILELEGIWNYEVKGGLTITFPKKTGLQKKYFWPVDYGEYSAAHAWIVAPPFKIVDATVRQQPYKQNEKDFLPEIILEKETQESKIDLEDIIEPGILMKMRLMYQNKGDQIMNAITPNLLPFTTRFKPEIISLDGITYKYSPTGIIAPDLPFEEAVSLKLNGKYGIQIYNTIIKPKLMIDS